MRFATGLILTLMALMAFGLEAAAECQPSDHQGVLTYFRNAIDKHHPMLFFIPPAEVKATDRAGFKGCVFEAEPVTKQGQRVKAGQPIGGAEFDLVPFSGTHGYGEQGVSRDVFWRLINSGKLKQEGKVTTVKTTPHGEISTEGLKPVSYALIPKDLGDPTIQFILIEIDIFVTGDVDVPLSQIASQE